MIQTERLSLWTKQESVYSGHILDVNRTGVIFATTPRWLLKKKKKTSAGLRHSSNGFIFSNPEAMSIFSYLSF